MVAKFIYGIEILTVLIKAEVLDFEENFRFLSERICIIGFLGNCILVRQIQGWPGFVVYRKCFS